MNALGRLVGAAAVAVWVLAAGLLGGAAAGPQPVPGQGPISQAEDATRIFPVEQVRPGLSGYGLTVVEGTRIDPFNVELLGVVRGAGPVGDLVLVRVSGPAIEAAGGIAAGMSGSPVYVDGRLLGAIGFAFEFSDHTVGLVTPIGDMLPVLDLMEPRNGGDEDALGEPGSGARGPAYARVAFARDLDGARRLARTAAPGTAVMVPVATPVMVSGLGPRTAELVRRWFARFGLRFLPGGGAPTAGGRGAAGPALEPGSAVGISLVRGDVELTAIGTVTYVQGDRFLAFGHPFLQKGSVDFFAAPAFIHQTVKSVQVPFKVGSAFEPTGVLAEDRRAAVAGRVGQPPRAIGLSVKVEDLQSGRTKRLEAEVVRDDLLSVPLMAIAGLEALDRGLDRIGPGTARVIYRIYGAGLPAGGVYSQDNVYFSRVDVSARLLEDFLDTLRTLLFNRLQDLGIERAELAVQVDAGRKTAAVVRARPLADHVRPGESVQVEVDLLPYRGQQETRILNLEIPADAEAGTVTVTVRGGTPRGPGLLDELESLLTGEEPEGAQGQEEPPEEGEVPTSLDKLLELLDKREKNNQLIAEFYPAYSPSAERPRASKRAGEGQGREARAAQAAEEADARAEAVKASLSTPWVIEGSATFDLTIEERPPGGEEAALPAQDEGEEQDTGAGLP